MSLPPDCQLLRQSHAPASTFLWEFPTVLEQALWPFLPWRLGPPLRRLQLTSSHLLGWWEGEKDDTESHESISVSGADPGLTDGFITGVRGVRHGQCPQLQSLLALPLLLDSASFLSISACGTSPRGHSILLAWGEAEGTGTEPAPETACSSRPHRCSLLLQVDRHRSEAGQG